MDKRLKVFAYITHQQRLLVMEHPESPEAGIQVPAGTLEPGESPEAGVLREAWEENLRCVALLGEQIRDMSDFGLAQIHHRYFFHLICADPVTEQWRHYETHPSEGIAASIPFDFYWVNLPGSMPKLIADHDWFVPQLIARMNDRD